MLHECCGMHFYADVGWIDAFLPNPVGLVANDIPRAYPSSGRSIEAAAQHALAADVASRRARSGVFQRRFLLQCDCHLSVAAPLKRNPLAGASIHLPYHTNFSSCLSYICSIFRLLSPLTSGIGLRYDDDMAVETQVVFVRSIMIGQGLSCSTGEVN